MRIDVITIFPEYLNPLELSLVGRARHEGIVDVHVHDLRDWTHDRHRTVDDTPYGGGAGMILKPDVQGEAIDSVLTEAGTSTSTLIIPTPSGRLFSHKDARRLSSVEHIVITCGRYEGIDARVAEHYRSREGITVEEFSIGDYVLAGGEVAALVMVEAITRHIPGVLGNPDSLVEESHDLDGLLEYPVYTKPPTWRGIDVPEVLLSGDHGAIAAMRAREARERTSTMRPDLLDE